MFTFVYLGGVVTNVARTCDPAPLQLFVAIKYDMYKLGAIF